MKLKKQFDPIAVGQLINDWVIVQSLGVIGRTKKYLIRCRCGSECVKNRSQIYKAKRCYKCARALQATQGGPRRTHGCCAVGSTYYKTYMAWHYMHRRCEGKNAKDQKNYTNRGITVCEGWHRKTGSFDNFLKDMGARPENASLERINNNEGYCPQNCRWAMPKEQNDNKRGCIFYTYNGEKLTVARWAERWEITRSKASEWLKREGVEWVIQNLEKIKACKTGMSNNEYVKLGLEGRKGNGQRKHQASRPFHPLYSAYKSWDYMKHKSPGMCLRWKEDFMNFIKDMGPKPKGLRLLRKFPHLQFSIDNCYWG